MSSKVYFESGAKLNHEEQYLLEWFLFHILAYET